ncbi:hypothetical protein ERICIV_01727 [Paenibacillus larvae subsp. larvae]|uniref:Uncharacterized protein n=3 Tax=Paenibacillus larvae TaxID=1464 RepID=A0A1V0UPQ5_9BACL|nr:hypothetical protein [Paenibacillus larvae]AQT86322.1 hypothetical protein B1222_20985 [Paenibacillus larvae subsp. pulvifaciens]AQZ47974.1 hypothetical protein B5S25_16645 [Paenibacillus larvae subsp. pulvifaciens]ARF66932.1 hypothetical protein B7C51_02610 [Paenibacillus larvae subsp. pulvifaciens]AVF25884.1 hypothetical protein ERICIII_01706 [Paenibacillus larvae subsp. larvae]AVF30661.1 hypothetical protein ERICIV_01727 [Paenibacillus larvae subsp. larvae]
MINKKPGKVCDLVHEFTVYNYNLNRRHIDFSELQHLVNEIIKTNEFAELIITPIYQNSKINLGIIWDNEDFSISMSERNFVTEQEIEQEISDIREKSFATMTDEQKYVSLKTVRLFPKRNVEIFQNYLREYLDFLDERLPVYYREVLEKVKNNHRNNLELLAFGYLGFEVICNNIV